MASAMFPPPNSNTPIPTFIIKDNAQFLDVSENKDVIFPIKVHRTLEFYSFGEQWPPGLSSPASQAPISSQAPVLKGLNFFFFTPSSPRHPLTSTRLARFHLWHPWSLQGFLFLSEGKPVTCLCLASDLCVYLA